MLFKKKNIAILLIHGFAGGIYDYGDLGNELQYDNDYDVFTFTLPKHDKLIIDNVTKDDFINSASLQIEKLIAKGYTNIYVIGHSMGGVIATYLATKYEEIKKLVLAAPAFKYFTFNGKNFDLITTLKKTNEIFHEYNKETIISRIFKVPIKTAKEFVKLVEEHTDDIYKINCPIMTIQGKNDNIVPIESAKFVFDNVNSKLNYLVTMDKVKHDIFTGNRHEEVYKLIIDFLSLKHTDNAIYLDI